MSFLLVNDCFLHFTPHISQANAITLLCVCVRWGLGWGEIELITFHLSGDAHCTEYCLTQTKRSLYHAETVYFRCNKEKWSLELCVSWPQWPISSTDHLARTVISDSRASTFPLQMTKHSLHIFHCCLIKTVVACTRFYSSIVLFAVCSCTNLNIFWGKCVLQLYVVGDCQSVSRWLVTCFARFVSVATKVPLQKVL